VGEQAEEFASTGVPRTPVDAHYLRRVYRGTSRISIRPSPAPYSVVVSRVLWLEGVGDQFEDSCADRHICIQIYIYIYFNIYLYICRYIYISADISIYLQIYQYISTYL